MNKNSISTESQTNYLENSHRELIKNLQRSGRLNEVLAVVLKLEEIVNDARKNAWKNIFFQYGHDSLLEDIQEEIEKAPSSVRKLISQMLFYRERRIERSISLLKTVRLSWILFLSTGLTVLILRTILEICIGQKNNWLYLIIVPVFFYLILSLISYLLCYFSTDIKFIRSFNDFVKLIEGASKSFSKHILQNLEKATEYSDTIDNVKVELALELKDHILEIKRDLLFLTGKVAEKEFELKANYIVREDNFRDKVDKIVEDINAIKSRNEVKTLQENLFFQGIETDHEMALASIKNILHEGISIAKRNSRELRNMKRILQPLTVMAARFESSGEQAWPQVELGVVVDLLGKISEIISTKQISIETNINNNPTVSAMNENQNKASNENSTIINNTNAAEASAVTTNQPGDTYHIGELKTGGFAPRGIASGNTFNDFSNVQDLTQAAAQIQALLTQLQQQGQSPESAQQQVANDLAAQAKKDPTTLGKLVMWGQKLGDATVTDVTKSVVKMALRAAGVPLP